MIKANVRIDWSGMDDQLDAVKDAIAQNLDIVADLVQSEAKTSSAFADKTGMLRRTIRKKKSKFEDGGYIVESRAPHAHLVEYGHVKIAWGRVTGERVPAHPFMRTAKEQGVRKAIELFKK